MVFSELCDRLRERLIHPLPGERAHNMFRAQPVGDVRPRFSHMDPPRPGGVLILLYDDGGTVKFPLIKDRIIQAPMADRSACLAEKPSRAKMPSRLRYASARRRSAYIEVKLPYLVNSATSM